MEKISENEGQIPKNGQIPANIGILIGLNNMHWYPGPLLAHMLSIARNTEVINYRGCTSIGHVWTKICRKSVKMGVKFQKMAKFPPIFAM